MIAHAIFFYVFSIIAIVSAIMVTASKNTVHSVFFLILDFISVSCLFIMVGAEFLGMIMLIVYVGAVAVLFLFVVMMLNVAQQKNQWFLSSQSSRHIPIGLIIGTIIFFELIIVIGGWKYKPELFEKTNSTSSFEGCILLIDYGYLKSHNGNTLQSVFRHKRNRLLDNLGKADVTSHINFELLREFFKKNNSCVAYF